ncbi:MAG: DUF1800 domain-containing protein [Microthrixaceae bacterium]
MSAEPIDTATPPVAQARPEAAGGPTRRSVLRSLWAPALVASAALAATKLTACDVASGPYVRTTHLLRRLTFGLTPADRSRFDAMGESAWLTEQLDPTGPDVSALDAQLDALPALAMTAVELDAAYPAGNYSTASGQLQLAWIIRAVHSPAQLYERLVEFFSDHFNVPLDGRNLSLLKVVEDREAIRPHARGRFADLLVASAQSPAMLLYLDNATSFAGNINENYARELLELHTLGVDGGYSEEDVVATARLLTGWTIDRNTFTFQFRQARHDTGAVTILGWQRPTDNDYLGHGEQFLTWLARQEATARFVCTKLARRFVADVPPGGLVDAMVAAWHSNDTAIAPVVEAMVGHPAFEEAPGTKFSRPLDYLAFGLRATGTTVNPTINRQELAAVGQALGGLGQLPFQWAAPNGYPDVAGAWLNGGALLARWNAIGDALSNASPVLGADVAPLGAGLKGRGDAEIYDALAMRVLGEPITPIGRAVLRQATGWPEESVPSAAAFDDGLLPAVLALLTSPDAQYR